MEQTVYYYNACANRSVYYLRRRITTTSAPASSYPSSGRFEYNRLRVCVFYINAHARFLCHAHYILLLIDSYITYSDPSNIYLSC